MKVLLLMVVVLATLSVFQSYQFLLYEGYFQKVVWGLQTVTLDYLAQRKANLDCRQEKEVSQ